MKSKNQFHSNAAITFGIIFLLAFYEFLRVNILQFVQPADLFSSKRFILFLFTLIAFLSALIVVIIRTLRSDLNAFFETIEKINKPVRFLIITILLVVPSFLIWFLPLPQDFSIGPFLSIALFSFSSLSSFLFIEKTKDNSKNFILLVSLFMVAGVLSSIAGRLNHVSQYPFPQYWSEGNRFFDYSALFGSHRYQLPEGKSINVFSTWGMQLPWALPFVFSNISIGFFRFWYELVWILPSIIFGFLLFDKKFRKQNIIIVLLFSLWLYVFLDQGPIYPPLIIAAILTIIAIRAPNWLGVILIITASYYARVSRWTWGFAPGLWAGMISLSLIKDPSFRKGEIKQLIRPVLFGISGYFGQLLVQIQKSIFRGGGISFIPDPIASTSRQPLLWERLLPNATFAPGILLGLAWAAAPVILFIVTAVINRKWRQNNLQILSALVISTTLLTIGIIASTKIGGGSNLHNLDMFFITTAFLAGASFMAVCENSLKDFLNNKLLIAILALSMISPIIFSLQNNQRLILPAKEKTVEALDTIRLKVGEFKNSGEILFIDHRQLLTFNYVEEVPLITDYEKKYLMDYAMAEDKDYFAPFYEDLENKRFSLIVNEPSNVIIRGGDYEFGNENDLYVEYVTKPLLCFYEPIYTSKDTSVELLIPRASLPVNNEWCK